MGAMVLAQKNWEKGRQQKKKKKKWKLKAV